MNKLHEVKNNLQLAKLLNNQLNWRISQNFFALIRSIFIFSFFLYTHWRQKKIFRISARSEICFVFFTVEIILFFSLILSTLAHKLCEFQDKVLCFFLKNFSVFKWIQIYSQFSRRDLFTYCVGNSPSITSFFYFSLEPWILCLSCTRFLMLFNHVRISTMQFNRFIEEKFLNLLFLWFFWWSQLSVKEKNFIFLGCWTFHVKSFWF